MRPSFVDKRDESRRPNNRSPSNLKSRIAFVSNNAIDIPSMIPPLVGKVLILLELVGKTSKKRVVEFLDLRLHDVGNIGDIIISRIRGNAIGDGARKY